MPRFCLSTIFCVVLIAAGPNRTASAAPPQGARGTASAEKPCLQVPALSESETRALAGIAEDPSLASWQRSFVYDLITRDTSLSRSAGESWHGATSTTDGAWSLTLPPTGRTDHTAIYDPLRGRMVVFGGYRASSPSYLNDVWALSLGLNPTWTQLSPAGTPPSGRVNHTAIYDPIRDRMVVVGGFGPGSPNFKNDVWALSLGENPAWTQLFPSGTPPSGRANHTATYDPARDRIVLFGGTNGTLYSNDAWALSLGEGPEWTQLTPTGTPPVARGDHTAIYDQGGDRVVVFGGWDGSAYRNDVWGLSLGAGPAWTELAPSGAPPSERAAHTAIYDPVQLRMLVFGAWDGQTFLHNDVWALSLGASPSWSEIIPSGVRVSGRWGHTAVYDPVEERMVVFGGFPNLANDAWAFSLAGNPEWTELAPLGTAPAGRWFHPAICDPVRDRMVVSGGYPNNIHDVWALTLGGSPVWTRLAPSGTPPSGRKNHSAIYDPIRDRMVIFGGFLTFPDDGVTWDLYLNDVWALSLGNNPQWTQLFPTGTPPSKRDEHSAIYDPVRDRIVVFGGYGYTSGFTCVNDTWALSLGGTPEWTQLFPEGTPPVPRRRHNAIYDPIRDRMVVFGGFDSGQASSLNDVWALSLGETPAWTQLFPTGTPPVARGRQAAIYDPIRDRMVIFGGYDSAFHFLNDVWALPLAGPPAWTQLAPAGTSPSVRGGHTSLYDPIRDRMVVFGGAGSYMLNDVWALVWGSGSCAVPDIVSYDPKLIDTSNCALGCTVSFVVGTSGDYSGVSKIILERYLQGTWVPEDSLLAPLPAPTWTLTAHIDQHYTDGEHVFRAAFRCADGSKGVSGTAVVVADRGVPVAIRSFEPRVSDQGVVLQWCLADAVGFRGVNIYRSLRPDEGYQRLNGEPIRADCGNEYVDTAVSPGRTYWYRVGALDGEGEWMSQSVSVTIPGLSLALFQNVPNPFNPMTSISFVVPERSHVTLSIYDVEGRTVNTLVDGVVDEGAKEVAWDGTDARGQRASTGLYFYRLTAGNRSLTRKMLLLK